MGDPSGRQPPQLLAATGDGLYRIDGAKATPIRQSVAGLFQPAVLLESRKHPGRVFVGLFDGLASVRLDSGAWVFEGRISGVTDEVRSMVEDADGRLWLGTAAGGVLRVGFPPPDPGPGLPLTPQVERFGPAQGLPSTGLNVTQVAGTPYFLSTDAIFRFDGAQGRFTPDTTFKVVDVDVNGSGTDGFLREDAGGNVWINFGRESAVARRQPDGTYKAEKQPFLRFSPVPDLRHLPGRRRRGVVRRARRRDPLRSRRAQGRRRAVRRAHPPRGRERRRRHLRRRPGGGGRASPR